MIDKINNIVADSLRVSINELNSNTRFIEDLQADSLDIMALVSNLEENFNIYIEVEEVTNIKTLSDLYKFIEGKINGTNQ